MPSTIKGLHKPLFCDQPNLDVFENTRPSYLPKENTLILDMVLHLVSLVCQGLWLKSMSLCSIEWSKELCHEEGARFQTDF